MCRTSKASHPCSLSFLQHTLLRCCVSSCTCYVITEKSCKMEAAADSSLRRKIASTKIFLQFCCFFHACRTVSVNCWCNSATFEQINRLWHRRVPFLCMTVRHWKIKSWQLACVKANIGQPWLSAPSHCCCSPAFYIHLGGMWRLFRWWRLCC